MVLQTSQSKTPVSTAVPLLQSKTPVSTASPSLHVPCIGFLEIISLLNFELAIEFNLLLFTLEPQVQESVHEFDHILLEFLYLMDIILPCKTDLELARLVGLRSAYGSLALLPGKLQFFHSLQGGVRETNVLLLGP